MIKYVLVFLFSVFVSSVSQIILKKSADKKYDSFIKEYLNPRVVIAYGMFFISTLLTMMAYKGVPLSMGPLLEASGYIYVPILSFFLLKEKISVKRIIGFIFILIGIVIYAV